VLPVDGEARFVPRRGRPGRRASSIARASQLPPAAALGEAAEERLAAALGGHDAGRAKALQARGHRKRETHLRATSCTEHDARRRTIAHREGSATAMKRASSTTIGALGRRPIRVSPSWRAPGAVDPRAALVMSKPMETLGETTSGRFRPIRPDPLEGGPGGVP
jgi:hypothetical protein